jgi:type II secretory ATPase GspE/PulE/Tfp pilus assembly ATPase PilB-like protein
MGAEDYLLASSILGVLAQRLVRVVCPECKVEAEMDAEYLREAGFAPGRSVTLYEGKGCKECGDTGYRGRMGLYELMLLDDDIRRLTMTNSDSTELRRVATRNGMVTLRQDGFRKVESGLTTIAEVLRVTQEN